VFGLPHGALLKESSAKQGITTDSLDSTSCWTGSKQQRTAAVLADTSARTRKIGLVKYSVEQWAHHAASAAPSEANLPISGSAAATNVEIHVYPEYRERLKPVAAALFCSPERVGIDAAEADSNVVSVTGTQSASGSAKNDSDIWVEAIAEGNVRRAHTRGSDRPSN
jgi:hypothetical protein